jgi:predicted DNA-binding transcriptional regulator AlpA
MELHPLTFDQLPLAVSQLRSDVIEIKKLLHERSNRPLTNTDRWLSLQELREYLPGKPATATIYGWVHERSIPHKKAGKRLIFRLSEIDSWLNAKGRKTIAESEVAATQFLGKKKGAKK